MADQRKEKKKLFSEAPALHDAIPLSGFSQRNLIGNLRPVQTNELTNKQVLAIQCTATSINVTSTHRGSLHKVYE